MSEDKRSQAYRSLCSPDEAPLVVVVTIEGGKVVEARVTDLEWLLAVLEQNQVPLQWPQDHRSPIPR